MSKKSKKTKILKIIPLGGLEEIGNNLIIYEYGNDIVVIDLGFTFPDETMPGVDYIIPDVTYLRENRSKIRGIIFTHGHLDHIGGIPYVLKEIGNPPLWGMPLTCALIRERLKEFGLDKYAKINTFNSNSKLNLGSFRISFFRINHNIPDGVGVVLRTPLGVIVHVTDFKFDQSPLYQKPAEIHKIAKLGEEGILLALSDSTNAEQKGYAISEATIQENMERIFAQAKGRIIVTTFASLIARIQQVFNAANKFKRRVAVVGLSMEKNIRLATNLGYLKIPKGVMIRPHQINNLPPYEIVILTTGSQGEEEAALPRISRGEHKQIQIQKGDTVILSSSPIPGNERAIQQLMNNLFRLGANVIYNRIFDIHASGHGYQEDLKLMLNFLKPRYFMPIHGETFMLIKHAQLAQQVGIPKSNIFILENGEVLEISSPDKVNIARYKVPAEYVLVDGLGVGDVGRVVLRDRQVLAKDGMLVVVVLVDNKTGRLMRDPEILSRGFVYVKASEELISEIKQQVKNIVKQVAGAQKIINWVPVRSKLRDELGNFIYKKTKRRPMILPVVLTV